MCHPKSNSGAGAPGGQPCDINTMAVVAAILGNALEWYDFIIYAFLAAFVAKNFFPPGDEARALLATLAAFALTFVIRPIGGILIGFYADRSGRRAALTLITGSMTVAMLIMVLTPTYTSIGRASTMLMLIARLLQSASAGGEFASAATYLLESVPERRRGLFAGLYSAGPSLALMLAGLVGLGLAQGMSAETRDAWGWRLPFAVGLLIAPVAYYIRRHLPESQAFARRHRQTRGKLATLFSKYGLGILVGIALASVVNGAAYVLLVYAPTYMVRTLKLPMSISFLTVVISGGIGMLCTPLMGWIADRVGALRIFVIGSIALVICVVPLYSWLNSAPSIDRLLLFTVAFALITAIYTSVLPTLMAFMFPVELRSTGMSIAYNTSAALFGGGSLYFITLLIERTRSSLVPAYYLLAIAVLGLTTVLLFYDRSHRRVEGRTRGP
jgi:MHS family proline/betaine transporter-like MFS transporter